MTTQIHYAIVRLMLVMLENIKEIHMVEETQQGLQTTEEYVLWANILDSAGEDSSLVRERLTSPSSIEMLFVTLNSIISMGQLVSQVKKYLYYGQDFPYREKMFTGNVQALVNVNEVIGNHEFIRLLHGVLGLADEVAELAQPVLNRVFNDIPIDPTNVREEAGDIMWYTAIIAKWLNDDSLGPILDANYRKLIARYPERRWTQERAINRDLPNEVRALQDTNTEDN